MPISLPPDTLIQGVVKGNQGSGSALYNVFHWWLHKSAGTINSDAVRIGIVLHLEKLWGYVRDWIPGMTSWDSVMLRYKRPTDIGWQDLGEWPLNAVGNCTTEGLPQGVSALVTGPTSTLGRRARKFLPPFTERGQINGKWVTGAVAALAGWAAEWLYGIDLATEVAWLYPIALRAIDFAWSALVSARANAIPSYQRRRKPGVGI